MIDMFANLSEARSYATRKNAERRLLQMGHAIPDNATVFVAQRPDGQVPGPPGEAGRTAEVCSHGP